jgi:hypothetical protein
VARPIKEANIRKNPIGLLDIPEILKASGPTAGVTGKGGIWREKLPDAESAVWGRDFESVGDSPHLSGARGVGQVLQDAFEFELDTPLITANIAWRFLK